MPIDGDRRALVLRDLNGWYDESHVLHGIDLEVGKGEVVTLLGRNGAGKSTILKSIMGILSKRAGSVRVKGDETIGWPSRRIARLGLGYVPEDRGIYSSLSVHENLMLPPQLQAGGLSRQEVLAMFPNIASRLSTPGTKLSGGEQQMLAIARVLRTGADLLLMDEPTEGLAPVIVDEIGEAISDLRHRGYTIVLVEQNFRFAAALADRHYVVEQGKVVDCIASRDLEASVSKIQAYLGV